MASARSVVTALMGGAAVAVALEAQMRISDNFHPEWGFLAPAPGFMRTFRIVVVAAAVGASAGAAVVFSLMDRPDADESVAARTLAQPAEVTLAAATTHGAGPSASAHEQSSSEPHVYAPAARTNMAGAEAGPSSTTLAPARVVGLAESPAAKPVPATAEGSGVTDALQLQKKAQSARRQQYTWSAQRDPAYGGRRMPLALAPQAWQGTFGGYQRNEF